MQKSTIQPKKKDRAAIEPLMPIVVDFPPNFSLIKDALPLASKLYTYSYAGKIYNPSGNEVMLDRQYHELVHWEQQQEFGDADKWWYEYLINADFRLKMEIEAYGKQYAFAKERIENAVASASEEGKRLAAGKNNLLKFIKEDMARALSGEEYGSLISYGQAETLIHRYGKKK